MSAVVTTTSQRLDGFAGYTDAVEDDDPSSTAFFGGSTVIKFDPRTAKWLFTNDTQPPADREYLAADIERELVKWPPGTEKGRPVERQVLKPHEPFPNVEVKNKATPQSEWRLDLNGNMVGPWQARHVLHLIDLVTTQRLVFPTSTGGGHAAVCELVMRVNDRRDLSGIPNLVAVIVLRDALHSKKYGTRRPYFEPVRFQPFGPGGHPTQETKAIADNTAVSTSVDTTDAELLPRTATMKDEIPY
jgi:hypothetical protein